MKMVVLQMALHPTDFDVDCIIKIFSLINLKLCQLKKFLKDRKKLLKKKYLKNLVENNQTNFS